MHEKFNTIIIGGGFYGLSVALHLHDQLNIRDILVLEKEDDVMERASYVNQARVHNGYHYPRSVLTGYRSAVNFPRFIENYGAAVVSNFNKYYAISRQFSKVSASQFHNFANKIGVDIKTAPRHVKDYFNRTLVDDIFEVKEYAFDSHELRAQLLEEISQRDGITVLTSEKVTTLKKYNSGIRVSTENSVYESEYIINCAYSSINTLHRASGLPLVNLKHEITEMCIIRLPDALSDFSITMMDGPFFSIMPFPSKDLWTLSHVRYTPHESWIDDENTPEYKHAPHEYLESMALTTNYKQMYNDVIRYIPALKGMEYVESIVEVKTVLTKSEGDDSRPILFKANHGMDNYVCIMGGKLDNIYDVFDALGEIYGDKK